ncbi:putative inactive dehydrogenase easA [Metarhizium anisopliae]|nr:putative inactive dehydrogenase easA [Metarhizium anisopliae]
MAAAKNAITASFNGIKLSSVNRYLLRTTLHKTRDGTPPARTGTTRGHDKEREAQGSKTRGVESAIQDETRQDRRSSQSTKESKGSMRDNKYSGSIKNRSRFTVEVTAAIAQAIRPKRIGVCLSPWNTFNAMKMADLVPQFSDVIAKLGHLNLAYLHLVDPRVKGNNIIETKKKNTESLEFAYKLWKGLLIAGGFKPEIARYTLNRLELTKYNRDAFYKAKDPVSYIDYPFSQEFIYSLEGQAVEVVLS